MWSFFKNNHKEKIDINANIDLERIPKHIAIIMDGNGRWAKERRLPRTMGHRQGVIAIKRIVKECSQLGVKYLTLYAFSTENWKRSQEEVSALMNLLVEFLISEINELHKNGVVVNSIGNISGLPEKCQEQLKASFERTKNNKGLVLNLALNYGGRDEIVNAVKKLVTKVDAGELTEEDINEDVLSRLMYTGGMPDPDLIIRPSGEQRLSNFLLWQCAYSEFWYSNIKWPDFSVEDLHNAIYDFQNRDRRFGAVK
ncbi:MAG: isoprenyl transferase [Bacillota bacterium]|nr:isoprenyl transferase [Bacillota bacterium]